MAGVWKRDGTVAVTNGSKKVTGTGTTFADAKNGVAKGHLFCMTTGTTVDLYEVDYVVSNTELHLVQAFRGTTGTGKAYEIITTFSDSIPEFARKLNASLSYYQSQSDMVQQLFTSDAAEITVTAPDGTTHKLIPWKRVTSEGEGQAARAKVEADKAAAAADVAVNVVRDAAAPFPDVWIPFSDSLRMFAGYGREVKVGDDVIARFVNFSRSTTATYIDKTGELKTAAINEPRFELEGLLIEGQSTNYIPRSENYDSYAKTNLTVSGKVLTRSVTSGESFLGVGSFSLPTGKVTISAAYIKSSAVNFDTFNVYCERFTPKAAHLVKVKEVGDLVVVSATVDADFSAGSASVFFKLFTVGGAAGSVQLEYFQMEALPFASSHIPTNGAAATRAQDVANIPWGGNIERLLPIGNKTTAAVEYSLKGAGPAHSHRILLSHFGGPASEGNFILRLDTGSPNMSFYRGATTTSKADVSASDRSGIAVVRVKADSETNLFVNGKAFGGDVAQAARAGLPKTLGVGGGNGGSFALYGHIRNLKLWNVDLSDSQIKALR